MPSKRSSRPPWPGSRVPMSFTPRSRLRSDSARSPSGRGDRQRDAEGQRLPERQRPEDGRRDQRRDDGDGHAADETFDRLVRTHGGERATTELSADEETADVVEHARDDGDQEDAHPLFGDLQQERGERTEQSDVGHAEHGDARVREHLGVAAHAEQVPQHREHEGEEQHQRHRRFAPPIDGERVRRDRGQSEQRRGPVAPALHRAEVLDAGQHDHDLDQDHGEPRTELHEDDRDDGDGDADEDGLRHVSSPPPLGAGLVLARPRAPARPSAPPRPATRGAASPVARVRRAARRGGAAGVLWIRIGSGSGSGSSYRAAVRLRGRGNAARPRGRFGDVEVVEGEELFLGQPVARVERTHRSLGILAQTGREVGGAVVVPLVVLVAPARPRVGERRPLLLLGEVDVAVGVTDDDAGYLARGGLGPMRQLGLARRRLEVDDRLVVRCTRPERLVGRARRDRRNAWTIDHRRCVGAGQREPQGGAGPVGRRRTIPVLRLIISLAFHRVTSFDGLGRRVGIDDAHALGVIVATALLVAPAEE